LRNQSSSSVEFDIGDSRPTPVKGRGHHFNASNQFWIVDSSTPLTLHHSFTIAAWIKVDSFSGNHPIFSKNSSTASTTPGAEDLLNFYIATDATPTIRIADGTSETGLVSGNTITAATWVFVAGTLNYSESSG